MVLGAVCGNLSVVALVVGFGLMISRGAIQMGGRIFDL